MVSQLYQVKPLVVELELTKLFVEWSTADSNHTKTLQHYISLKKVVKIFIAQL